MTTTTAKMDQADYVRGCENLRTQIALHEATLSRLGGQPKARPALTGDIVRDYEALKAHAHALETQAIALAVPQVIKPTMPAAKSAPVAQSPAPSAAPAANQALPKPARKPTLTERCLAAKKLAMVVSAPSAR
jgi:hypothetical protein